MLNALQMIGPIHQAVNACATIGSLFQKSALILVAMPTQGANETEFFRTPASCDDRLLAGRPDHGSHPLSAGTELARVEAYYASLKFRRQWTAGLTHEVL